VRDALCLSVHRSFVITRSHYENIDPIMMSQGFMPSYSDTELGQIEYEVAKSIEDEVIPRGIS
jgi:hypothetical protein